MGSEDSVTFSCVACKETVRVRIAEIELIIGEDNNISASYFCSNSACPSGGAAILSKIGEKSAQLLKEKNVLIIDRRKEKPPPITYDDLLDFHEYLKKANIYDEPWFKKLVPKAQRILRRKNEEP